MSYRKVAEIMNMPQSSVYGLVRRVDKLRAEDIKFMLMTTRMKNENNQRH